MHPKMQMEGPMYRPDFDIPDEETPRAREEEPVIDFESDGVDVRGEAEANHSASPPG